MKRLGKAVELVEPEVISEPTTTTIGIDIGFGVTKVYDGRTMIKFPSVWGPERRLKFQADEIHGRYPGETITDDEGTWFVGDLASGQLPTGAQRRLRGRTPNEVVMGNVARVRLAKVALGKLFPKTPENDVVHVRIATGLPVDHMHGAGDLKAALLGQHEILTDRVHFIANVVDVMVMPQPYGTIYANTLLPDGRLNPEHTARRTGVCDIGTFSIDVALDERSEFIDAASGSVESGMYMAQDMIATAYEQEFHEKPSLKTISEIMTTGVLWAHGEEIDMAGDLERAIDPVRQAAIELMTDKWQAGASVDIIYCSGGGAARAFDDIKAAFRQAVLMDNAQMANAIGYRHYAMFRQRKQLGKIS